MNYNYFSPKEKEQRDAEFNKLLKAAGIADYTATREIWGHTRFAYNRHALYRAIGRFYEFTNFNLLTDTIAELFDNEQLEHEVMGLPFGAKFTVTNEADGFTVFAQIGWDEENQMNICFVHTILVYNPIQHGYIFVEESNRGLYRINQDGSVTTNPEEIRFRIPQ